jgi:hypothetical protein
LALAIANSGAGRSPRLNGNTNTVLVALNPTGAETGWVFVGVVGLGVLVLGLLVLGFDDAGADFFAIVVDVCDVLA